MGKKKKRQEAVCDIDQDGNFAFIAGYTPGGFPYGITWEEQAEIDRRERKGQLADEGPDDYHGFPYPVRSRRMEIEAFQTEEDATRFATDLAMEALR